MARLLRLLALFWSGVALSIYGLLVTGVLVIIAVRIGNIRYHSKVKLFLQVLLSTFQSYIMPGWFGVGVRLKNWCYVWMGCSRPASTSSSDRLLSKLSILTMLIFGRTWQMASLASSMCVECESWPFVSSSSCVFFSEFPLLSSFTFNDGCGTASSCCCSSYIGSSCSESSCCSAYSCSSSSTSSTLTIFLPLFLLAWLPLKRWLSRLKRWICSTSCLMRSFSFSASGCWSSRSSWRMWFLMSAWCDAYRGPCFPAACAIGGSSCRSFR